MDFSLQVSEFVKKAKDNADESVRRIIIALAANIDKRSPVGDGALWEKPPPKGYVGGRFRGNWQYGFYPGVGIPMTCLDNIDPSGESTQAAIAAAIPDKPLGVHHVLINNLPYAQALERGHSTQSPPGAMVGLTVVEFQQVVDEAVAGMKEK